jgi:hypothetical protein
MPNDLNPGPHAQTLTIEIELEGETQPREFQVARSERWLEELKRELALSADTELYEVDADEPLSQPGADRSAFRLVAHRLRHITVVVRYEHEQKDRKFRPGATIFRVLQWAVSKKGFNLDAEQAPRANLILPGEDAPLPKEATLASVTPKGEDTLVVDLTLKDFTNG